MNDQQNVSEVGIVSKPSEISKFAMGIPEAVGWIENKANAKTDRQTDTTSQPPKKGKNMKRYRGFCFTLNNYTDEDLEILKNVSEVEYAIFGKEIAPTTLTKHIQGFIYFKLQKTISAVIKWFHGKGLKPHVEVCKGNIEQNITYCSKEGDFMEIGKRPKQGQRNDLIELFDDVKEGKSDVEIMEKYGEIYLKYFKAIDRVRMNYRKEKSLEYMQEKYSDAKLKEWQEEALKRIENQNDRQITWIVDFKGNTGKTFLAKHLLATKDTFYVQNGKCSDVAHAYNYEEFVVFDFTRSNEDRINYSVIESFKNGLIFSPKYDSTTKIFKECKVLCLSNFMPEMHKLSSDRWDIMELNETS
jgi:hypothetical protein